MSKPDGQPAHYAVLLFPGFQLLDVAGPIDVLTILSWTHSPLKLSMISETAPGAVPNVVDGLSPGSNGTNFSTRVIPTYSFANAPADIDCLIVPGGAGTRAVEETQPHVDFIRARYPHLSFIMSVCTGSALLARAGILDKRNATTNKQAWDWVLTQGPQVNWVRQARWVVDGNIWTTSGVSAGIDGALGLIEHLYGTDEADIIAARLEYSRAKNSAHDPFA